MTVIKSEDVYHDVKEITCLDRIVNGRKLVFDQYQFSTLMIGFNKWKGRSRICNITVLRKQIEETRKNMYEAYQKNPEDPEVLFISQQLDVLLNKYDQLQKNAKKPM